VCGSGDPRLRMLAGLFEAVQKTFTPRAWSRPRGRRAPPGSGRLVAGLQLVPDVRLVLLLELVVPGEERQRQIRTFVALIFRSPAMSSFQKPAAAQFSTANAAPMASL